MKKLLIADDGKMTRQLICETLAGQGYEILQASDGEEALEVARRDRPQLVLLDVGMPRLDGLEVCRQLKADPVLHETTVIMLTARSSSIDWVRGKAAGADHYLTKPFHPIELMRLVKQVMEAR